MTLEQYVSEWLANRLSMDIKTVPTVQAVSAVIVDATTINKWIRETGMEMNVIFKSKTEASDLSALIERVLHTELPLVPYVMAVYVDAVRAERSEQPEGWKYTIAFRIRHRTVTTWQH